MCLLFFLLKFVKLLTRVCLWIQRQKEIFSEELEFFGIYLALDSVYKTGHASQKRNSYKCSPFRASMLSYNDTCLSYCVHHDNWNDKFTYFFC